MGLALREGPANQLPNFGGNERNDCRTTLALGASVFSTEVTRVIGARSETPKYGARDWLLRSILVPVDLQQICSTLPGNLVKKWTPCKIWNDVRGEMFAIYAVFCMRNT